MRRNHGGRATMGETVPAKLASIATDVTNILYLSRSYTRRLNNGEHATLARTRITSKCGPASLVFNGRNEHA